MTRVHYREGQILRAIDLRDEQAYRIQMRRRHHLAHHAWGIVEGLGLQASGTGFVLTPGLAIDGYGRELIVPQQVLLDFELFTQVGAEQIDVWLLYRLNAVMSQDFARCREEAVLWLTAATSIDPRRPPGVPAADWAFGPHQEPPDDPARRWPVYLGRISRSNSLVSIDPSRRPYVGLAGQQIMAPSGQARLQVGSEAAGDHDQFVVSLRDENNQWTDRLAVKEVQPVNLIANFDNMPQASSNQTASLTELLTQTTIRGDIMLTAGNDLILAHPGWLFRLEDMKEAVKIADELRKSEAPWSSYHLLPQLLFQLDDIKDLDGIFTKLQNTNDPLTSHLRSKFDQETLDTIEQYKGNPDQRASSWQTLVAAFDTLLQAAPIYDKAAFDSIQLRTTTQELLAQSALDKIDQIRLNRLLLEDAYSEAIWALAVASYDIKQVKGLINYLNYLLLNTYLYNQKDFPEERLRPETKRLLARIQAASTGYGDPPFAGEELVQLNRYLLEDAFPNATVGRSAENAWARGAGFDSLPVPLVAAPWQIYRTILTEGDTKINQLRVELDNPGKEGDPSHYQFIIGRQEQRSGQFTPCLTVTADGTVTIHGDLLMADPNAQISEGPLQTDLSDARYTDAIVTQWITGVSAAVPTIESVYQSTLAVKISELARSDTQLTYTVTVENTGVTVLNNILIFESLGRRETGGMASSASSFDPSQSIVAPFTLTPGQSMTDIARSITLQDNEVVLAISAIGVTPTGLTVSNFDQKLIPTS